VFEFLSSRYESRLEEQGDGVTDGSDQLMGYFFNEGMLSTVVHIYYYY